MKARLLAVALLAVLAGCAGQTYEGRFAEAGRATVNPDRSATFKRSSYYKQPAAFTVTPEAVAEKFGHLCKAKQACVYFADQRAYYLVPDYGLPGARPGGISQTACPIVDGVSGSLLRIC
ncbi:MAG: hypothetical protein ACM30H_02580 [Clostridia bacterium]